MPADHIFDEIAKNMKGPEGEQLGADSAQIKSIFGLVSLKCTQVALRRVCEYKGTRSLYVFVCTILMDLLCRLGSRHGRISVFQREGHPVPTEKGRPPRRV
jgi:hypothetical protein